ncbi:unnamed protein product [Polarella glacialis]|uniref:Uncharacterized protein n=1 Tax=Polarella glacialis TaxID=89957 RepID=A0A813J952_POLGL|nr:unnamed protein product [Polarella glacialis]
MSQSKPKRSSHLAQLGVLVAVLGAASYSLSGAFVGAGAPDARGTATQMEGYRLDWMAENWIKPGSQGSGDNRLQVQDGFFIGERGFEKSQNAQGLRYRMRPMPEEYKKGIETDGLMFQFGPLKIKLGEAFGGSGNNDALRDLKRKKFAAGITDPAKIAENEYWAKRYGHKRWVAPYIDQSGAQTGGGWGFGLRGLAAWSGYDPLREERGKSWKENSYGKPWLVKYKDARIDTQPQLKKLIADEQAAGKVNRALPAPNSFPAPKK